MKKIYIVEILSLYEFEPSFETKVFGSYENALSCFYDEVETAKGIAIDEEINNIDEEEDEDDFDEDEYVAYTSTNGKDKEYVVYKYGFFAEDSVSISLKEKEIQ